jgi:uncharacterized protein
MFIWDAAKEVINIKKHGIAFSAVYEFDFNTVVKVNRTRDSDNETRFAYIGYIQNKLHTMIFTPRSQDIRIISLRRSNSKEKVIYEKTTQEKN